MSYVFYKVLHLTGIIMIFLALGAGFAHSKNGGERNVMRKWIMISHGIGMLIAFVAGFGLMARLGLQFSGWLWIKLVIWLILGGVIALIYKKPKFTYPLWASLVLLTAFATWLANTKPF